MDDGYKYEAFPARVNEFFVDNDLMETFGARSKVMYKDSYYYLVETSKYNTKDRAFEYHIALCDSAMVPLTLLPFYIPKKSENETYEGAFFFGP